VRFAIPLLVALTALALVSCGGDDDEQTAAPVTLAQRFLTAGDAPGTKPDPVETRQTTADFDEFIAVLRERAVDPDDEEMTTVFQDAGFESAGVDLRFYGETHAPAAPHLVSSFVELGSEDGAKNALEWLATDSLKPCPVSCAFQISDFDVSDIADARGAHRIATAEDIERTGGAQDQEPLDSYWIGFTDGSFVYTVELRGLPGSVSEDRAEDIARAYHDRLTGD
jgi:hypothetical protein